MTNNPWPEPENNKVLFIIDASHKIELDLLSNWLTETKAAANFNGEMSQVIVAISKNPENISVQGLQRALQVSPETLIVPIRVVWLSSIDEKNTRPRLVDLLSGNTRRPSFNQAKKIVQKDPSRALCLSATPATLAELKDKLHTRQGYTDSHEMLAEYVANQACLALDTAERRLHGSRYKVPRQVANNLKSSTKFKTALAKIRNKTDQTDEKLSAEIDEIMHELIARPRPFWQDVMETLTRKIMSLGYEGNFVMDEDSLERFRNAVRDNPSVMLWTHKTHIDGFAMYSVLFENDFPAPHVLGGVNMAFAGLGFIAKRAGAIFIRRSFQDNPLYKLILKQYIGYLLEKRFPLTWAFEGTRSRVGKLMPPRYGLLKYVIESAHATDTRNLHIIPVAINYDLIGDVRSYVREQSGSAKTAESLRWFISYLRGLRQPMGRIYIDFGEPVVLDKAPSGEDSLALAKIALQVGVEANRVTPITLASLISMTLLGAAPRALTREEMQLELDQLSEWAQQRNIRMSSDFDRENAAHTTALTQILVDSGLITRYDAGPEVVYGITADQHAVAGYYRNTIIHHFLTKAIAELALLYTSAQTIESSELFWQEAEHIRDLFKFEFFYAPSDQFKQEVREELNRYRPDWEQQLDQQQESALNLLVSFEPHVAHATLLPYVEGYRVVSDVLARLDEDQSLTEKNCISQSLAYGTQAYLQRRITSEASIGKLLFENGYKLIVNLGLAEAGTENLAERRKSLSQEFRRLAHRLDRIRAIALPNPYQD